MQNQINVQRPSVTWTARCSKFSWRLECSLAWRSCCLTWRLRFTDSYTFFHSLAGIISFTVKELSGETKYAKADTQAFEGKWKLFKLMSFEICFMKKIKDQIFIKTNEYSKCKKYLIWPVFTLVPNNYSLLWKMMEKLSLMLSSLLQDIGVDCKQ